jgi:hypothetical protein
MKSMRVFCLLLGCFTISTCAGKTETDADLAKALFGTWTDTASDNEPMHTKVTYNADGRGVELIWPRNQPPSTALRLETTWSVTNRILVLKCVKSSDTQKVPEGTEIKDRIISTSPDQFIFQSVDYGNTEKKCTRTRLKEPN